MKRLWTRPIQFLRNLRTRIAFYPTLFALIGFLFSFVMIYLEGLGISNYLLKSLPQLVMEDGDTALTVLSVCIGGLISMMVFSFSMVMLLLSQASSNFSPRLLPGLISDRKNQFVLGIYLATIIYTIFTLFSIESTGEKYTLPGFSVLISIVLTIGCFAAFIYFIHSISLSIQIDHILDEIYESAKQGLTDAIARDKEVSGTTEFPDPSDWPSYRSTQSGYIQNISIARLLGLSKDWDNRIYITIPKGMYVLEQVPFIKSQHELTEEQVDKVMSTLHFDRGELISDNHTLAFKQITEIIVKAMSPGINDPGTAINGIDYLTSLFALRMTKEDKGVVFDDGDPRLRLAIIRFPELIYNVMASLRTYCKHDPIIMQKLLWMLSYLSSVPCSDTLYAEAVAKEMKLLLVSTEFDTPEDSKMILMASRGLSGLPG